MNPLMKKILCVVVVALLAACGGLPKHKEISTDNPSILEVIGAPEGAEGQQADQGKFGKSSVHASSLC